VPTPHDALFKRVFERREDAIGELKSILPAEVLELVDLGALQIVDRSFVDANLVERHTDQLYSVPIAGRPGFVYLLFEHKSRAERWTLLQMLGYMVRVWQAFLRDHPDADELPPIVPLVLHHDEGAWGTATHTHQFFSAELMAHPALAALTPAFGLLLDDLGTASDEALRARQMSTFARLALWALRDGRSERLVDTLQAFGDFLADLVATDSAEARMDVLAIFTYIYEVQGHATLEALAHAIPSPRIREAAMTIAEQLRQEGLQEGLQRQRALLRRLIVLKFGELHPSLHQRLAQADFDALDRLAERVVTASSLEELLASE
jgi:predicted transposase YdaD